MSQFKENSWNRVKMLTQSNWLVYKQTISDVFALYDLSFYSTLKNDFTIKYNCKNVANFIF